MINLNITTEQITLMFNESKDQIQNICRLSNLRFVGNELKGNFNLEMGPLSTTIPIKVHIFSSDDASHIILRIGVSLVVGGAVASKLAAKKIVSMIPIPGTTNNGGDIFIPITQWCDGMTVLQTEESITVHIRKNHND